MSKPAPKIFGFNKKIKPFTNKQNREFFDMLLNNLKPTSRALRTDNKREGKIIWFEYDPKDTKHIWDRKPLVLVLGISRTYMLGINLHWVNLHDRLVLVNLILSLNMNPKSKKFKVPLEFTYGDLKSYMKNWPELKKCIHLYIRKRMSPKACLVHPKYFLDIARLKLADFR